MIKPDNSQKSYFKLNVSQDADERTKLFQKQLKLFTECINQVSNTVKNSVCTNGSLEVRGDTGKPFGTSSAYGKSISDDGEEGNKRGESADNGQVIFDIVSYSDLSMLLFPLPRFQRNMASLKGITPFTTPE
jgi:hypothetical protein